MTPIVRWFINNPIAANILMIAMLIGGFFGYQDIKKEPFPRAEANLVTVSMAYPGASPVEVEQQIVIRIEEAIANLPGIFQITSESRQGFGTVSIEVIDGVDPTRVLNDVKARVDSIFTFPASAERPVISQVIYRVTLTWFAMWGDADATTMKQLAYQVRDDISLLEGVSEVRITGMKDDEINIEISEETLRRYRLTLSEISDAIRANSLNVPAGIIKSSDGNIQVQTRSQGYVGDDFAEVVIRSNPDGSQLLLGDIAIISDGLSEQELEFKINSKHGHNFEVMLSDDPKLFEGTANVRAYLENLQNNLPEGVHLVINFETKSMFDGRFNLLKDNAFSGLTLVFIVLMLFLRPLLAIWVVVGIATAFAGAFWLLPAFGISLNMLSLFAFLLVLGIVVDDAIIVGESIYHKQQQGLIGEDSALAGTKGVLKPVVLAVLSTIIFFLPMIDVPSEVEPFTISIFFVVFMCLVFSLVESLFILPSHLSHMKPVKSSRFKILQKLEMTREKFAKGLEYFAQTRYKPALQYSLSRPVTVVISFVMIFAITLSLLTAGWVGTRFFPNPPMPFVMVQGSFPEGSPYRYTVEAAAYMKAQAQLLDKQEDLLALNNGQPFLKEVNTTTNGTSVNMYVGFLPPEEREIEIDVIATRLTELIGPMPDLQDFSLSASQGGNTPEIQLNLYMSSNLVNEQKRAVDEVLKVIEAYPGVFNARSNLDTGSTEIEISLKPTAETLGLTMAEVATQVRQSFYGEEVQRIPRSKEDVRVMLRYPLAERSTLDTLDEMRIRTRNGVEVPLETVALVELVPGTSTIRRTNRSRNISISANIEDGFDPSETTQKILADYLPQWQQDYQGFDLTTEGNLKAQAEFGDTFQNNFLIALLVVLALFAIALKSIAKPFLIISAVPFGFVGAVWGHLLFGLEISMMSFFGFLACSGVVVNDNLVLLERLNQLSERGMSALEAGLQAGIDRFRPIVLTSLTTFIGLVPIMFEPSLQAQFLIPMVVALAFGVLVSSFVTLFLVPTLYFLSAKIHGKLASLKQSLWGKFDQSLSQ